MCAFKVLLLRQKTLEELLLGERKELNNWEVKPNFKTQIYDKEQKIQKLKRNEDYQINTVIDFYFQIKHMGQHQNEDEGRVQKIKIKTYY